MDEGAVDLELGPATQVPSGEFSIRVDGVEPDQAEAVRRRVAETLQRRWDMGVSAAPERPAGQREAPAEPGQIRVGLVGPSTFPTRQRELEDSARAAVASEMGSDRAAEGVCICMSGVPGDQMALTADFIPWFVNGVWTPPPGGGPAWIIGIALDSGWNWARLTLRDGATVNPPVPKSQALVGLANSTDWAKEIWADNLCSGRIGSVFQEGTNSTPRRMLLNAPDCWEGTDTIVFRKPGFWGIWHDVGHVRPDVFWQAFGGTWGDWNWVID
jgi:hypothetical protein